MPRRRLRVLGAVALLLVALLLLSELILPGVAERRVRKVLRAEGHVTRVEVSSFPALKLLAGHADRVEVRMSSFAATPRRLSKLLSDGGEVDRLEASAGVATLSGLKVRDARLRKRGRGLTGSGTLEPPSLLRLLPPGFDVQLVDEGPQDGVVLEGQVGPIGGRARLSAAEGALFVRPEVLFGGLASVKVFEDDRVSISSLSSSPGAGGLRVRATGRLRR